MLSKITKSVGLIVCGLFLPNAAFAQVAEVRIGVTEFDERTLDLGLSAQGATENSAGINGEILFAEPEMLKWAFSPQPYIGGTLNLGGKTSFGGAGLLWRQSFGEKFYGDFAFGVVAHTGTTRAERKSGESLRDFFRRLDKEISFGSRLLFREQIALGYNVDDTWSTEVYFEHLSNAGFASPNEGVDNLGFRAVRKF